ncbi:MAG: tetratricopeptide repeat protein [Eubacteriales bacterium]
MMLKLSKIWYYISLLFYLGTFLYLVSYKAEPISSIILPYILYFVITKLIFLGNTIGYLGLVIQLITKKTYISKKLFKIALKLKATNVNILSVYSLILLRDGKTQQAKNIYENLLARKDIKLQMRKILEANLAICFWKLGELDKAINQYESVTNDKFNQQYITANDYTTLGYLHIEKNNLDKALRYTEWALKLDEKHSSALDNLGQIYYKQEDYERAISYFKKAIELKKYSVDSNYYLGLIYEEQENYKNAKSYYENALKGNMSALNSVSEEMIKSKLDKIPVT